MSDFLPPERVEACAGDLHGNVCPECPVADQLKPFPPNGTLECAKCRHHMDVVNMGDLALYTTYLLWYCRRCGYGDKTETADARMEA